MKKCNDINFLNSYWAEAKAIAERIKEQLPMLKKSNVKSGSNIHIVNFSDISGKSWAVEDVLKRQAGVSKNLEALADKIYHMIYRGRANDVKPMIDKIATGRIKKLTKKSSHSGDDGEYLGRGHFRWNNTAYTLDQDELNHIKTYFEL